MSAVEFKMYNCRLCMLFPQPLQSCGGVLSSSGLSRLLELACSGRQVANVLPVLTSSGNAASDGPALQAAGARAGPAPPCELSPALATDWCGSAGHPVVASEAASGRPPLGCAFDGTPNRRRGTTEMDYDDA